VRHRTIFTRTFQGIAVRFWLWRAVVAHHRSGWYWQQKNSQSRVRHGPFRSAPKAIKDAAGYLFQFVIAERRARREHAAA
jgi:hypothetical protein